MHPSHTLCYLPTAMTHSLAVSDPTLDPNYYEPATLLGALPRATGRFIGVVDDGTPLEPVPLSWVRSWPYGPLVYDPDIMLMATQRGVALSTLTDEPIWYPQGHTALYLGYLWPVGFVLPLQGFRAVHARAHYLHTLHSMLLQARVQGESAWLTSLTEEHKLVLRAEQDWMRRRIMPRLMGLPGPDACWLWTGGLRDGRPAMDYRYAQSVPPHRLLWPLIRPESPLAPNDRPRRNNLCTEPYCINPKHFNVPGDHRRTRPVADPRGRRGLPNQYGQYRYIWDAAQHVREMGDGRRMVCCPQGHPFSPKVQRQYQDQGGGRGKAHCAQCYQAYLGRVPRVRVRQATAWEQNSAPSHKELEDVAKMELWRGPTAGPRPQPQLPEPDPDGFTI